MATSLTAVGILWATLSLAAALLCCTGFYLPFWIQGRLLGKVDAYFSSFRRCNYPRVNSQGVVEIVEECGRYTRFWDIPSPWWQASTVLVGTGSAISLLIAVTATAACCITYVVHAGTARLAGALQLIAALLVIIGGVLYPIGWDNREFKFLRISGESRFVADLNVQMEGSSGQCDCGNAAHQRVAFRLAHQFEISTTPSCTTTPCTTTSFTIANAPSAPTIDRNKTFQHHPNRDRINSNSTIVAAAEILPMEKDSERAEDGLNYVQSTTANVPLSPTTTTTTTSRIAPPPRETNNDIIIKDLPKCLMQSQGNEFD